MSSVVAWRSTTGSTPRASDEIHVMELSRRKFLVTTAASAAALPLPAMAYRQVRGANDDIRVGVVGLGRRGRAHIRAWRGLPGVRVVAVSDVDELFVRREVTRFNSRGEPIRAYVDLRDLLADDSVDVVSIATPNHWHALMTIWACRAGKDVYVEAPVSHSLWEGRRMVEVARETGRIVQAGTQSRSSTGLQQAVEFVRDGNIGPIELVRGLCYQPRPSIGKTRRPMAVPASVDYDLWCGPAPRQPLMRRQLHNDWRWAWSTGNGDIGNQGVHQLDMCRMVLGDPALPRQVRSVGGRLGFDDDGETPNTLLSRFDCVPAPVIFEVRGLPDRSGGEYRHGFMGARVGVVVHCEGGHLLISSYEVASAFDRDGKQIKQFAGRGDHFANFLTAVRSRRSTDLNADILTGHRSSGLCHLANISFLVGRPAPATAIHAALAVDAALIATHRRMRLHLAANGVEVSAATLGAGLVFDPEREDFGAAAIPNRLLRRSYRSPFSVD